MDIYINIGNSPNISTGDHNIIHNQQLIILYTSKYQNNQNHQITYFHLKISNIFKLMNIEYKILNSQFPKMFPSKVKAGQCFSFIT